MPETTIPIITMTLRTQHLTTPQPTQRQPLSQSGLSLLEVLYAILLFAIISLALSAFQSALIQFAQSQQQKLSAHQLAFQILERYPNDQISELGADWSYEIETIPVNSVMSTTSTSTIWINVKVTSPLGYVITQRRIVVIDKRE